MIKRKLVVAVTFAALAAVCVVGSIVLNRETNQYPPALAAYQVHLNHAEFAVERVVNRGDAIMNEEGKPTETVFSGVEEMGRNRGVVTHPIWSDNGKIHPMTRFWPIGHTELSVKYPWLRNIYGPIHYGTMEVDGIKIRVLGATTNQMWYAFEK